jgi:Arc/MetJ-type ribon-helix-helix transcriptional regulator
MPISVRLPPRVEQKLAEYCVSHKISRSEAVKQALDRLFETGAAKSSPWELGADIFVRHERVKPTEDIARHSKRLLRERLPGKVK